MEAGLLIIFALIWLAAAVFMIAAMWKIFVKAGQPGWAAIVPIYNTIIMLKIADKPTWWIIWFLLPALPIPFVNIILAIVSVVFSILVWLEIVQKFGKSGGFVAGIILLPIVFIPILGFGSAQYTGGIAPVAPPVAPPVAGPGEVPPAPPTA